MSELTHGGPTCSHLEGYVTEPSRCFFANRKLSNDRPVKRCKYELCGKVSHLEKDCRKKEDIKKRIKQKVELTSKKQRDREVVTDESVGDRGGHFPGSQDYSGL